MSAGKTVLRLLAAVGVMGGATAAYAQLDEPPSCAYCYSSSDGGAHTTYPYRLAWYPGMFISCNAFNSCHHSTSQPGSCAEYHFSCSSGAEGDATLIRTMEGALARNDRTRVRDLMERYPRRVRYEAGRREVAVFSCNGKLARRIAVPTALGLPVT